MADTTHDKALTLRLDSELHNALAERARIEDRSLAALIRVACRGYLAVVNGEVRRGR